jgi:hypothetical protein
VKKWVLIGLAVIGFLVMLYSCALPGALPAGLEGDGLAGTYTVNGIDPTGVEYGGTAVLTATDDPGTYGIEWIVTGGIHDGTGVLAGDQLTVTWSTLQSAGGTGAGTGRYTLTDDGRLVGTRSIDGVDEPGTEELFPEP